ncbi:MAG TPA: phospholipase D-like domain-containing protein, partial [Rhodoferax sp.]|nr:phospholipase D-like domain-containing protein [Rhodoferax sp.]
VSDLQTLFLAAWAAQNGPAAQTRNPFPAPVAAGRQVVRAIGSSPDEPYSLIYATLISALRSAETEIWITNAYFVPDPQLVTALEEAVARGVDVRLVLPSSTDSWLVFHAGRANYTELLEAGVKIYERQDALLHVKAAVIDGVWSTVGSTNLDWRSFLDNDEVNAVILGREFAAQMEAMHQQDLGASQRIEPQAWENRPLEFKLKEWLAQHWGRLL